MRGLVYMASRDKVDVDAFHKAIQYALEKLGKSKFGFEKTAVSNFKSKRHKGSGNDQSEQPIRFVRLDSEHAQSDGKSVNR